MDDLLGFIRARAAVAEWNDEDLYQEWHGLPDRAYDHARRHDPARVLREVEAGRRLLRAHAKWCSGRCEEAQPEGGIDAAHYWEIKNRASVYADHPDYREEWRP